MSKPNGWHPCFLPDDYFKRLKQYQADLDRGIEERNVSSVPDESPESESEREAEVDRQATQPWGLTDAELVEIQRSLKELTE